MTYLPFILEIAALVLFILASINVNSPKISLGWAGLSLLTAAFLIGATPK